MSKQINVNIRMDSEVKEQADRLFNELGFNLTTAINAFVRQSLRDKAIPFYISANESSPIKGSTRDRYALIARGRKLGRVLSVSESFEKYPVKDEDHGGKLEYWTQESDTK